MKTLTDLMAEEISSIMIKNVIKNAPIFNLMESIKTQEERNIELKTGKIFMKEVNGIWKRKYPIIGGFEFTKD